MFKINKGKLDALLEKRNMSYFDLGACLYPKRPVKRQKSYIGVLLNRTISFDMATRIMNALNRASHLSFCDRVSFLSFCDKMDADTRSKKLDTTKKRHCVYCGCSFTPFEEGEGIIACRGWDYCSIQCLDKEFSEVRSKGKSIKWAGKREKKHLSLRDRRCENGCFKNR